VKLIAHNKFRDPIVIDATSVLILDDFGNAIAGALWHQPGHIQIAHIHDEDFKVLASLLGCNRRVIVQDYKGVSTGESCQASLH
jgi:hypothetical protein